MADLYLREVVLDIIPEQGTPRRLKDMKIQFKCAKTNTSSPNKAEISIYNLAQATRSLLEAKNTKVNLSFGYLGLNPNGFLNSSSTVDLVFVGDVTDLTQNIQPPDVITKIQCGDGDNRSRNARHNKGYPPNAKLDKILKDLGTSLGLAKSVFKDVPDITIANGFTSIGLVRDNLDVLTKSYGLEWSIQDDALQVIPEGAPTADKVILISSDSGLVGSPKKTKNGIEFESLIQPSLKPGRQVQIKSNLINGVFKLRNVTHEGDSTSGSFLSKCEAN